MLPTDPDWLDQVALARRRLISLARVTIADYADTWYAADVLGPALEMVGRHARGFYDGISHLMIEMPTQTGKTLHTCLFICQLLGQDPRLKIQDIGYGEVFMQMCGEYVSAIANSEGFAAAFPNTRLGKPQALDTGRVNDKAVNAIHQVDALRRHPNGSWRRAGGSARFHSIKGAVSGRPGDVMMLEDPYKGWDGEAGALSPGWNAKLVNAYEGVFRRRMKGERSCEVHAYTPWTDSDIRTHVLGVWRKKAVPYLRIKLPMLQRTSTGDYPEEREELLGSPGALKGLAKLLRVDASALRAAVKKGGRCRPYDPRTPGQGLPLPTRTQAWVEAEAGSMLSRELAALWDLWPIGDLINRFPKSLWRPWDPEQLPIKSMEDWSIQADPNGDETEKGCFASVGVWAARARVGVTSDRYPMDLYRTDELRDRPSCDDFINMICRLATKWPEVRKIDIEDSAYGRSIKTLQEFRNRSELRGRTINFIPTPDSKLVRWDRMELPLKQGCGHVPIAVSSCGRVDPAWVSDREGASAEAVRLGDAIGFLTEVAGAGRLAVCDRVDEAAQAFDHWRPAEGDDREAWKKLSKLTRLSAA
jgi:hypothetical protein